jgi:hypothetical protein
MEVHIGSVRPKNLNYSLPYVRTRLVTHPVGSDCGCDHIRHLEGPITGTS